MRRSATGLSRMAAALIVVAVLAVAGFAAWEWPAYQAARDARRALAEGRFEDAWRAVARWLRVRPRAAEAHYLRAKTAIALGRRRDIGDGLRQAKALGYSEDGLAVLRAVLNAHAGRLDQARPILDRAFVESREPDPIIDEALARVYLETYDFAHAATVLSRWARDAPRDPRPYLWRAAANRRRNAEAAIVIADFREALERDPKLAEAHLGLAEVLAQEHREVEAAEAYSAYLKLRPDDPAALVGAGRAAAERGDQGAAVRALDRALELDPDQVTAHLERAKVDLRRNQPSAALVHLDRAVALTPFDPVVHYHRSQALKLLGRNAEAAEEHAAHVRLQRDRDAVEELQERLAKSPHDPDLQSQIARWMFLHGYDKEALKWSRKILTDTPGHRPTCLLLADYYDRNGQPTEAEFFRHSAKPTPALRRSKTP